MGFEKTEKQVEACRRANAHRHFMAYGGSRSGKTTILVRNVILRAAKTSSKHLIVRYRYNHARVSLGHETIPFVLDNCFPGLEYQENRADGFYSLIAADGGESQIWLGGTDDKERIEKILGNEYSTIYANECSQIPWEAILLMQTRLAETSGLTQRFYYDANPPGTKHWTYKLFMEQETPEGEPCDWDMDSLIMNPRDNLEHLSPEYIMALESMPKRYRQRFLDGLFLSDIEGALWTDEMMNHSLTLAYDDPRETVVGVDPAVSSGPNADECGIVVCSIDGPHRVGTGIVHADYSAQMSTDKWAQKVVDVYHAHDANVVVAEKNNGGDLVRDAIHAKDRTVKVKLVSASKGKKARAEPVSQLYELEQQRVAHAKRLPKLEAELTETVFDDELRASPNRLDAMVWGLSYLFRIGKTTSRVHA